MKAKNEKIIVVAPPEPATEAPAKSQLNVRVEVLLKRLIAKASRATRFPQEVLVEDAIRHYYGIEDNGLDDRRKYVLQQVEGWCAMKDSNLRPPPCQKADHQALKSIVKHAETAWHEAVSKLSKMYPLPPPFASAPFCAAA